MLKNLLILSNIIFKYSKKVIIEPFIKGQEIQVAVFEKDILGILEIQLLKGKKIYDYETKYSIGFANHIYPARISEKVALVVRDISQKIYSIFRCRGLVRIEFIYDNQKDILFFLEVNTVPGMTKTSICPEIALHLGISYTQLVAKMIEASEYEKIFHQ